MHEFPLAHRFAFSLQTCVGNSAQVRPAINGPQAHGQRDAMNERCRKGAQDVTRDTSIPDYRERGAGGNVSQPGTIHITRNRSTKGAYRFIA